MSTVQLIAADDDEFMLNFTHSKHSGALFSAVIRGQGVNSYLRKRHFVARCRVSTSLPEVYITKSVPQWYPIAPQTGKPSARNRPETAKEQAFSADNLS
jgi:hypothetical protein